MQVSQVELLDTCTICDLSTDLQGDGTCVLLWATMRWYRERISIDNPCQGLLSVDPPTPLPPPVLDVTHTHTHTHMYQHIQNTECCVRPTGVTCTCTYNLHTQQVYIRMHCMRCGFRVVVSWVLWCTVFKLNIITNKVLAAFLSLSPFYRKLAKIMELTCISTRKLENGPSY